MKTEEQDKLRIIARKALTAFEACCNGRNHTKFTLGMKILQDVCDELDKGLDQ